jgi:hypothetical protein
VLHWRLAWEGGVDYILRCPHGGLPVVVTMGKTCHILINHYYTALYFMDKIVRCEVDAESTMFN